VAWVSLYANHIEGIEPGGTAQQIAINAGETLPAALSRQDEAGVKLLPVPGLLVTAAWFRIDRASSYINDQRRFVQDGRAVYKGGEFSAAGEITPALSVTASAVILDARQSSGAISIVGKRIENTARFSGSMFATYRVAQIPRLSLSAGLFRVGRRAVDTLNQAYAPSYTTVDLGGGYQLGLGGRTATLRLYGENVTARRYWAATGSGLLAQGAPTTIRAAIGTTL
jgi:iron complex outermembrane receptor protein